MTIDLDAIRERAEVATPGPWKATASYPHVVFQPDDCMISTNLAGDPLRDAAFIAHARDDLPNLIAEIERLRAVAWQYHRAMTDQHEMATHFLEDACEDCQTASREGDPHFACDDYKRWQKAYMDALGCVIGPEKVTNA